MTIYTMNVLRLRGIENQLTFHRVLTLQAGNATPQKGGFIQPMSEDYIFGHVARWTCRVNSVPDLCMRHPASLSRSDTLELQHLAVRYSPLDDLHTSHNSGLQIDMPTVDDVLEDTTYKIQGKTLSAPERGVLIVPRVILESYHGQ
jgi:hypothetical protein